MECEIQQPAIVQVCVTCPYIVRGRDRVAGGESMDVLCLSLAAMMENSPDLNLQLRENCLALTDTVRLICSMESAHAVPTH